MSSGTIALTVAADAVDVGNAETLARVAYSALPTVEITFSVEKLVSGGDTTATLTFSESVTGLRLSDLSVDVGSLSNFSGTGDTYTVDVAAPSTGSGTITLTVALDAVDVGLTATSASIDYEPFSVSWSNTPSSSVDNSFRAELHFSHPVSGLTGSDLTLQRISGSDGNARLTPLTDAQVSVSEIEDTYNYSLDFELTGTYNGVYQIRLRRNRVQLGGTNYPNRNTNTGQFRINSSRPTATVTFDPTTVRNGRTTQATIVWSESVTGFAVGDLSVDVGSLSNFSGTGDTYTVDVTAPVTGSGTMTLTVAADAVDVGNAETLARVAYSALPTATITFDPDSVRNGRVSEAEIVWSESVSDFAVSDLSVDVGSLSNFAGSGTTWTVDVTAPATGSGTITLTIAKDAVSVGNAAAMGRIAYSALPTATITFDPDSIRNGRVTAAEIVWSESVTGFSLADVSVDVGSLSNFAGSGDTYTVDVTAPATGSGAITLTIREDAVGIGNSEATGSVSHSALPTVAITFDPASVRGGRVTEATIEWSESVTGFEVGDLSIDVGTLSNFSGSGDTYTVDVTAPASGTGMLTLTIAADAVSVGNGAVTGSVAYQPLPTVAVTFDPTTVRNGRTTEAKIVWSESVTGFEVGDLSVDIGSLSNFSGSGDTYTVDVEAPASGTGNIALTIAADAVGVGNAVATASVAYQPLPTVAITFDPASVRNGRVTEAEIVWSETVTDFSLADVSVDVGALSNFSGSGDTYTVDVTAPATGSGDITLTIREDAVSVGNAEATGSVAHSPLPTVAVTFNKGLGVTGRKAIATLTFSESVTGLALSDLSVDVGSLDNFSGSGDTYNVRLSFPNSGSGTMTLTVAADAVDQGLAVTEASIDYAPFSVTWSGVPSGTVDNTFSAQLNFSHPVTGLAVGDITLRRESGDDSNEQFMRLTNSQATLTQITDTHNYTIDLELTGDYDGVYQLRLRPNTVRSDGRNYPASNRDTSMFTIDSDHGVVAEPTVSVTFNKTSIRGGRTAQATLVWSESVDDFTVDDVSVDVGSLSNFAGSGTTYTVDVAAPVTGSGTLTLTVAADAVSAGNAAATGSVSYSPLPTATLSFDTTSMRGGRSAEATIEWSESVTGFTLADLSVDVGSLSNFSGSGDTYSVDVTAPVTGSGNIVLTVRKDAVNEENDVTTGSVAYQPLPTVAITFDPTAVRGGRKTEAEIVWSESVTGFDIADISVDVGSLSNFAGSGDTYTVDVTAPASGSGTIVLTVREDAAVEGNAETTGSVAYQPLPTAVVSFSPASVRGGRKTQATVTWSENVTGFAVGNLSVDVGSLDNFSGSGDTYTVDVTAPISGSGTITLTIALDAVNEGNAATTGAVAYQPLPTVAITFNPTAIRGGRSSVATLTFSESVTGFEIGDVSVDVGSVGNFEGSGDTYTVDVTAPVTGSGNIVLTVRKDAVNEENDATTGSIAYQPLPTVAIAFDATSVRGGRVTEAMLTFSESVTGFDIADVSVNVGTLSNFSGSGDTYTVDVRAPVSGTGNIVLTVREDAAVEGNAATTGTVAYQPLPTVAITFDPTLVRNGRTTEATLTFSESVTGLAIGDLSVDVGSLSNFAGSGRTWTVDVTAPVSGSGTITLTVALDAVTEGLAVTTSGVAYAPLPTATVSFSAASVRWDRSVVATVTFSESVTGFSLADISVDVGSLSNFSGTGDTWTVDVTAPASGTGMITLTVRGDAVDAGNSAVTGQIPYSALPTVDVTFGVSEVIPGNAVVARIDWSESVSGFTASDVVVTGIGATVLGLSGSGRAYQLTIQTPVVGTGTIRVMVIRDAVSVGNAAAVGTIGYAIPGTLEVEIITGYATRYVVALGADVPADLNDVRVGFRWERAVEGFDIDDVVLTGADILSFTELTQQYYEIVVRPPDRGSGIVSVRVNSGAVLEGNRPASASFRYTSSVVTELLFDWDAVIPDVLQGDSNGQYYGPIAGVEIEGDRIRLLTSADDAIKIFMLRHDGTRVVSGDEAVNLSGVNVYLGFIYARHIFVSLNLINDRWFASSHNQDNTPLRQDYFRTIWSYRGSGAWEGFSPEDFGIDTTDFGISGATQAAAAAHSTDINRWGLFFPSQNGRVYAQDFSGRPQEISGLVSGTEGGMTTPMVASGDRVYAQQQAYRAVGSGVAVSIAEENLSFSTSTNTDYAVYGKWLYYTQGSDVLRVDLEKYRTPAVRPRIVPQFVVEGERLALAHFASGADQIIFDGAYDPPAYMSIDADLNLVIDAGVISGDTCILVKFRAFSFSGDAPFGFYLVILKKDTPVWKDIDVLPMDDGETVNLYEFVRNAKQIFWKNGFRVPAGYVLSGGQLTVSNQTSESPVAVEFTAFNDEGGRDIRFTVLPRIPDAITTSDLYDYRVLIEGIDVSEDLLEIASIHRSLDVINPNEFVSDDASFVLSSDGGKYDGRVAGNFFDANGFKPERLFIESRDVGRYPRRSGRSAVENAVSRFDHRGAVEYKRCRSGC